MNNYLAEKTQHTWHTTEGTSRNPVHMTTMLRNYSLGYSLAIKRRQTIWTPKERSKEYNIRNVNTPYLQLETKPYYMMKGLDGAD